MILSFGDNIKKSKKTGVDIFKVFFYTLTCGFGLN